MSTLQELIRYCNEDQHLGALLLTGEWGSGKTYLIEKELADALRDTHFIVRVSLFGVDSIESMRDAVRRQWLLTCTPLLGKLQKGRDGLDKSNRFLNAFNSILRIFNPVAGNVASAIITVDPLEYIPLEPEVDDYLSSGRRKEVVLVFDDLIHSKLDWADVVGNINEYCENLGFKTILIANEEVINASTKLGDAVYKRMKEKTIVRTVLYVPDYQEIIHGIIANSKWPSQEYADFLRENEQMIIDVFASDPPELKENIGKYHNIRSLIRAVQEFPRVYDLLAEKKVPDKRPYLYSFITYILITKSGIYRDGKHCFDVTEEEIRQLYPDYSPETLPKSLRRWIDFGVWNDDAIARDLAPRAAEKKES